jgi:hypothetical protein
MDNQVEDLIEVRLKADFLVIKETLTRIGVASKKENKLFQSCHILHKRQKYYILHFKELFKLDGKPSSFSEDDVARRNTIVQVLEKWGLIEIVNPQKSKEPVCPLTEIKIIANKEKKDWELVAKYTIGNKK